MQLQVNGNNKLTKGDYEVMIDIFGNPTIWYKGNLIGPKDCKDQEVVDYFNKMKEKKENPENDNADNDKKPEGDKSEQLNVPENLKQSLSAAQFTEDKPGVFIKKDKNISIRYFIC